MTHPAPRGAGDVPANVVRVRDLGLAGVLDLLDAARRVRAGAGPRARRHDGAVLGTVFRQPSTRTSLSFRAAAYAIGADVLDVSTGPLTRMDDFYAEPLGDVLLHLQEYADVIVLRHHEELRADLVSGLSVPVVNAGDGYGEHPTQALGDLLTLLDAFEGDLDGRRIGLLGDTRLRTIHSLLSALTLVAEPEFHVFRPRSLAGTPELPWASGATYHDQLDTFLSACDAVYVSGFSHPDFSSPFEPPTGSTKHPILRLSDLRGGGGRAPFLLHPGPAAGDLDEGVSRMAENLMWQQVRNCLHVRTALLDLLLTRYGSRRGARVPEDRFVEEVNGHGGR